MNAPAGNKVQKGYVTVTWSLTLELFEKVI